jgi:ATP-dependent Clp protease adaptor protein ClpS
MSTITETRRRARGPGEDLASPCRVIVLNDDHNTFQGVAAALAAVVPGISYDRGLQLADQIHSSGRSVVWSGDREAAELYWEQLKARGLTMAPLED